MRSGPRRPSLVSARQHVDVALLLVSTDHELEALFEQRLHHQRELVSRDVCRGFVSDIRTRSFASSRDRQGTDPRETGRRSE
jgi:hypothetical protein